MKKAILHWSTGKDAAYVLYQVEQAGTYDIVCLSTTVQQELNRVSMHGIRRELLLRQVAALKRELQLDLVEIPNPLSAMEYKSIMGKRALLYKKEGIQHHVYGDILLTDLKEYREQQLNELALTAVFPLWQKPTASLLIDMVEAGFKAVVVCVNEQHLDKSFLGRTINQQFLKDLPTAVDPCGENGEFHTFVYDGPIFKKTVDFKVGESVYKTYDAPTSTEGETAKKYGFWFLDLL